MRRACSGGCVTAGASNACNTQHLRQKPCCVPAIGGSCQQSASAIDAPGAGKCQASKKSCSGGAPGTRCPNIGCLLRSGGRPSQRGPYAERTCSSCQKAAPHGAAGARHPGPAYRSCCTRLCGRGQTPAATTCSSWHAYTSACCVAACGQGACAADACGGAWARASTAARLPAAARRACASFVGRIHASTASARLPAGCWHAPHSAPRACAARGWAVIEGHLWSILGRKRAGRSAGSRTRAPRGCGPARRRRRERLARFRVMVGVSGHPGRQLAAGGCVHGITAGTGRCH